jgi:phosphoribosylaminoimidazole-succinocarboxamide synthase
MLVTDDFLRSGKVRDLYELPDGRMVLLASDRISAFDVILPNAIPDKGRVLTALSRFWFAETAGIVRNHLLDTDVAVLTDAHEAALANGDRPDLDGGPMADLRGRIMICEKAEVVPIEAVVRGYLAGSGWKEYQKRGTVCGIPLPSGLRESDRLPEPIFTPATKAEEGEHDQNISFDGMIDHIDTWGLAGPTAGDVAESIRDMSIRLFRYASAVAARAGIILADTKFEFGIPRESEHLMLIDEALTPDSSRFWDATAYEPGRPQASFDKQFVRDWLETQPWDKTAPGPALPDEVVKGTRARYIEAYERITGASFERYLQEDVIAP